MQPMSIGLGQWRSDSQMAPVVRIGVVLAEDALQSIELKVPNVDYISADGKLLRSNTVSARLEDGRISAGIDGAAPVREKSWSIGPKVLKPARRGDGVLVKDVVA